MPDPSQTNFTREVAKDLGHKYQESDGHKRVKPKAEPLGGTPVPAVAGPPTQENKSMGCGKSTLNLLPREVPPARLTFPALAGA